MAGWLLDYDGCIANTFGRQIELLNARFGTTYTENHFTKWATEEILSQEENDYMWSHVFPDLEFQRSVHPVEGALGLIAFIRSRGDRMMVVSDRPESLYTVTTEWLRSYGLGDIPVIFTRNPHTRSDQHEHIPTKAEVAAEEGFLFAIEDSLHNALSLSLVPNIRRVFLRNRSHNQGELPFKIKRVTHWQAVPDSFFVHSKSFVEA